MNRRDFLGNAGKALAGLVAAPVLGNVAAQDVEASDEIEDFEYLTEDECLWPGIYDFEAPEDFDERLQKYLAQMREACDALHVWLEEVVA